jgi:hypothetical protein
MDHSKAKSVLGNRIRVAYDDLFLADKSAQSWAVDKLKGWFKTKTGVGDAVAKKMATTFKALATYASFDDLSAVARSPIVEPNKQDATKLGEVTPERKAPEGWTPTFTYRIEVHLPDTTNVETYRSIFKAIREELG